MPEERSVLVIDDNAATRTLVAAVLQRAGLRRHEAADAAQAVEELRRELLVILLDYRMPHTGVAMVDSLSDRFPHLLGPRGSQLDPVCAEHRRQSGLVHRLRVRFARLHDVLLHEVEQRVVH